MTCENIGRLGHFPHRWSYCITKGKCIQYKMFKMHIIYNFKYSIYIYIYTHIHLALFALQTFLFKPTPTDVWEENLGPGLIWKSKNCTVWRLRTRKWQGNQRAQQATCVDMVCIYVTFEFTHHECHMHPFSKHGTVVEHSVFVHTKMENTLWPFVLVILLGWALRLQHLRDAYSTRFPLRSHDYGTPSKSISENVDMTSNPNSFLAGRETNSHMFALTISFSRAEVWGGDSFWWRWVFQRKKSHIFPDASPKSSRKKPQNFPPRFPKESRWFPLKT